jgi:3',5'-cyclic-AMP phosphodiesterase
MKILCQFTLVLLLTCFSQLCFGQSLYQRSLAQFEAKALRVPRDNFTFVVLGDSRDGDEIFKRGLKLAKSYDPLFVLHGGDYSGHGGEGETAHFLSMVNGTIPELPLFVVLGNHENREVFAREIGPANFTLKSKRLGLTLVAVDDAADALQRPELNYLQSQLEAGGKTRFVAMHVPPKTDRWSWHVFTEGAEELKTILARNRVQGAFFSHVHLFDKSEYGGVPAFITGGAGARLVPFGFPGDPVYHILVVRVKKGKVSFEKVLIPER